MGDQLRRDDASGRARLAGQLKALAHPARLRILELLAARGTCICGEIVELMPLAQATVSQHLKVLKQAGFVRGTIDGPRSCYCLDPEAVARFRGLLDARLDALAAARIVVEAANPKEVPTP